MKKAKMKKRGPVYLVYRDRRKMFKCYDEITALFYYNFLRGIKE